MHLKIVTLHENTTKSVMEIASDLGISHSQVSRVIAKYKATGNYETDYKNCGRKAKFDERDLRRIRNVCLKSPRSSAADVQREIGAMGDCCVRTVQRALLAGGCKAIKPSKRPFLSSHQMTKRYQWALQYRHWDVDDWKNVLWSDETSIQLVDNCPRFVRLVDGHAKTPEHYQKTLKHPTSVMIWACFSWHGTGRAHVVEGMMDTDNYITNVIDRRVVQQMLELFPDEKGYFQQDNAPCHVSKRALAHFANKNITLLPWPPASPDLNPIENLWAIVKRRLRNDGVTSKANLVSSFVRVWHKDAEVAEFCKSLVSSMPQRIEAVIKAKGGQTNF